MAKGQVQDASIKIGHDVKSLIDKLVEKEGRTIKVVVERAIRAYAGKAGR